MDNRAVLREVTLTLPMLPDMEIAASKTATAMAEFMDMGSDRIDEVRMAVVEACINAFEHSQAADRKVYMTFSVLSEVGDAGDVGGDEPSRLQIVLRDTGVGFEPGDIAKPMIEEKINSKTKRGWGLQIIQGLMDDVEITSNDHGTKIVMTKHR